MRTLERAFAVISCFSPTQPSLTLQEIADRIGLAKSTTFRLVGTLERLGYLVRLPDLRYSLSHEFVRLGAVANRTLDVKQLLRPVLEELVQASGENVSLNSVQGQYRHCVDVARSKAPLIGMNRPGEALPLGLGAASMVLMAYLPRATLREVIGPAAAAVGCSVKELESILHVTREQGYAVSHGGGVRALTGISAPIFEADGSVKYALTVVVPTTRVTGRVTELMTLVKGAAAEGSRRLGGSGAPAAQARKPAATRVARRA
jgi:IclR family transcriptional regulator, KDG regulon repressor